MRDVAELISERLLPGVKAPGQYIGLEINARRKNVHSADVTVALAFPDAYTIGISHLGSQVLYQMLNDMPGVACDRTYCPQIDAEQVMRREHLPLFGWESRCDIRDFDILGFSLTYELCITNVLTMLDLAGIALHAADRGEEDPIVIGGDALADTPEPIADFFDLFLVGDGEEPLRQMVDLVARLKPTGATREQIIAEAAEIISAAYVPRFHQPEMSPDGTFAGLVHTGPAPAQVKRAHVADLSDSPAVARPLVPHFQPVHDRVVVEIMRGCPNACRFCQAGATKLPVRWRDVDEIVAVARAAIAATGYSEISLLSLSTSDYPHLDELIERLDAEFSPQHVSISLPSLRVGGRLSRLPKATSTVRKGGLTIAAEAATPRLRRAIAKNITDQDMIAAVTAAYQAGWRRVKVYFMAGLPGETDADIDGILELCKRLSDARKEVDGHPGSISASVSWFVPKPHTPMQWCAMRDAEYFFSVRRRLMGLSRRSPVNFKFHRIERSILEAVICRSDRRLGAAIEAAWRNGARMDAWNECFDNEKWQGAFQQTGIDPAAIAHHDIPTDAPLPWSHIAGHRSTDFLLKEYRRMMDALNV